MACRYIFNGKTYAGEAEFRDALTKLEPAEAAKYIPGVEAIPSAPFIGSTEDWSALALKRILRMASEEGYSKVAWTTGEQQAARYDLSKHVDSLSWTEWPAAGKDMGLLVGRKGGDQIIKEMVSQDKLADYIGKDAAEKLLAGERDPMTGMRRLEGDGLKVGGEGMAGFYDKILPAVMGKLGKKWGAKVGETAIDTGDFKVMHDGGARPFRLEERNSPDILARFETGEAAWAEAERRGAVKVHSIAITPEMRRSVMEEGQPLFKTGQAGVRKPLTLDRVEASNPGLKWAEKDGQFVARLSDGGEYRITQHGEIEVLDKAALEASRQAGGTPEGPPRGMYRRLGKDSLVSVIEPDSTLDHEAYHFFRDRALNERERAAAAKRYGDEESEAYAYEKWRKDRTAPNSWFSKIFAFARRLVHHFRPTWESTFEEVASGRAGKRVRGEAGPAKTAFASADDYARAQEPVLREKLAEAQDAIARSQEKASERLRGVSGDEFYQRGDAFRKQLAMAITDGRTQDVAKWQERVDDYVAEKNRREALAGWQRQEKAARGGLESGKLFVGAEDIPKLLSKRGDVYRDAKLQPNEIGQWPDRPDLWITSDLSGRKIRNYIKLPDGRIAHPDELHEWKQRGRIISDSRFAAAAKAIGDRAENFKRWFGKSKAVDADGAPLTLYHGTSERGLNVLSPRRAVETPGVVFLSSSEDVSSTFTVPREYGEPLYEDARGRAIKPGPVHALYAKIENPLILEGADAQRATDDSTYQGEVVRAAKAAGHDGVIFRGVREGIGETYQGDTYGVFDARQVKSTKNKGTFDPNNPDIRYAAAPAMPPQAPTGPVAVPPAQPRQGPAFSIPEETWLEKAQRQVQDKFNRVARIQEVVKAQGGRVSERTDIATAIDAFGPKVAEKMQDVNRKYVDPFVSGLGKDKVALEDAGDYMSLLHVPDRDALISQRTNGQVTNGSGWTPAETQQRWHELEQQYGQRVNGKILALEPHADKVRAMRDEQIRVLMDGGLLSQAQANGWRQAMGDNYVPLRRFEATDGIGGGQGFDIRGKEAKSATGRSTKADNPVTFMLQQLQRAIVRSEKNKVEQRFAKLIEDNPDSNLWEIDKKHEKQELDAHGKVKTVRDQAAEMNDLGFKIDGEGHRITIKDPLLDRAMKNLSAQETGAFLRHLGTTTRLYSRLVTTWAPEFMFTNFARDIQTALVNAGAEHGTKIAGGIAKNVVPSVKAIYRVIKDPNATGRFEDYAKEFKEDGGSIGFYALKDIPALERELRGKVTAAGPGAARALLRTAQGFKGWVEDANASVESGTRLAAYAALRDAGVSRQKAASVSRNLTVNFGKKGEAGTAINALYAFSNASIQGTKRLVDVLKSPKGAAVAASVVGLGFTMDKYNRAQAGDEDNDGTNDYDSIPEYVKERNLVFMRGKGQKPILFPMPYGYNILHNVGRQAAATMDGAVTPQRAAAGLGSAAWNAFNPLGGEADLVQTLTPTMLDPIVQDVMNRDFTGKPIRPEGFPGTAQKPSSEMYYKNVPPLARSLASVLNRATGGDKVTPGFISVSPETMDHYFKFLSGGMGRFGSNVANTVASLSDGEAPSIRNVPLARRFVYDEAPGQQGQKFRENTQELDNLWMRYTTYRKEGNRDGIASLPMPMLKAKREVDAIDNRIRQLRKAKADGRDVPDEMIESLLTRANRLVARARQQAQ